MDELLAILSDINPDVDFETAENLVDGKVIDSFTMITLVGRLCDEFDISISPRYIVPANFNSAKAMWKMIQTIQDED